MKEADAKYTIQPLDIYLHLFNTLDSVSSDVVDIEIFYFII